jgi:hypothetical protein
MATAHARIATPRAVRYGQQLCQHLDQLSRRRPEMQIRVEWSASQGLIHIGPGRCNMDATADALSLQVTAPNDTVLGQLTGRIGERLERFGRRDGLVVSWATAP